MRNDNNPFAELAPAELHGDWSLARYLAHPAPSRSDLWRIHSTSPYEYHWRRERETDEETDAMRLGSAVHTAVLEPDKFEGSVAVFDGTRRGKAWEEFKAEHDGKTLLTPTQHERAVNIRDYVRGEPKLCRLFEEGQPERSIVWTDEETELLVKARPDWLDGLRWRVVDLKTTSDLDDWALMRSVKKYGYHLQGAMFLDACDALGMEVRDVWLLFVASDGPPLCKLKRIPDVAIDEGRAIYRAAMDTYAECWESGQWPRPEIKPEDLVWTETL